MTLTLKQAARACYEEYSREAQFSTPAQERAARAIVESEGGDLAETAALIIQSLPMGEISAEAVVLICLRFGMRIQRKLNDPEGTTTVWCGACIETKVPPFGGEA